MTKLHVVKFVVRGNRKARYVRDENRWTCIRLHAKKFSSIQEAREFAEAHWLPTFEALKGEGLLSYWQVKCIKVDDNSFNVGAPRTNGANSGSFMDQVAAVEKSFGRDTLTLLSFVDCVVERNPNIKQFLKKSWK